MTLLTFSLTAGFAGAASQGPPYPRLANVYLHGAVDPADIPALAKWNLLVLDPVWTNAQLQELRDRNPAIKLFFYVCPYCMSVDPPPTDSWRQENLAYVQNNDLWWRNNDRSIASDWPGSQMINITAAGPVGPFGGWRQFLPARIAALVTANPQLDGIFYDNYWRSISWEQGGNIRVDSDCSLRQNPDGCDGVMDSPAVLDSLWNSALRQLAQSTRASFARIDAERPGGRSLALASNAAGDYFTWLNGTMYEHFPTGNSNCEPNETYYERWRHAMLQSPTGYLVARFSPEPYGTQIINACADGTWDSPVRNGEFERHKRFTLASTLLGDGYYSLDNCGGHGSLWWEPEYDGGGRGQGYLGYPIAAAERIGQSTGPEIVANGGFVTWTMPWEFQQDRAVASLALDVPDRSAGGLSAARIDVTSVEPGGTAKIWQIVNVLGGTNYTLSFWARASAPMDLMANLYSDQCAGYRCLPDHHFALGTDWQRYDVSFTSTGTAAAGLTFFYSTVGTVWMDDVSLRMGDTAAFRRDFEQGIVLVNATENPVKMALGADFYHLWVPGSLLYDGAQVNIEIVPPFDARILLRTSQSGKSLAPGLPVGSFLESAPNPLRPYTDIRFGLSRSAHVQLAIYDVAGRLVRTLLDTRVESGVEHTVRWEGNDADGRRVTPGVYFYRLISPDLTRTGKLTVAS